MLRVLTKFLIFMMNTKKFIMQRQFIVLKSSKKEILFSFLQKLNREYSKFSIHWTPKGKDTYNLKILRLHTLLTR
jgi:hypothetical protein